MNISRFVSKHHDAFTLVEFIVIMSIFAVMVGVVMFNFNGFRSAVTLDNLAHDIGISIRQIQTNSGASLSGDLPEIETPRGISFTRDPENTAQFAPEFTLFKDIDGNGIFDEGYDEKIDTVKIQTADRITAINYTDTNLFTIQSIEADKVGITFKRYKTDARFATNEDLNLSTPELTIIVAAPDDNNGGPSRTRTVTVSKIGQVSIK